MCSRRAGQKDGRYWREPEPVAALLSNTGDPQTVAGRFAGSSLISDRSTPSASIRRFTTSVLSRTTGRARRSAPPGLGWECWCGGMEVCRSSPTSSRSRASRCAPGGRRTATYGLERLAMYVQGVSRTFTISISTAATAAALSATATYFPAEPSRNIRGANFEFADTTMLFEQFSRWRKQRARNHLADGWSISSPPAHAVAGCGGRQQSRPGA